MYLDWLLHPIAQYVALAIGLIGCLALFLTAQRELQIFRRASGESNRSIHETVGGLCDEIRAIRESVSKLEAVPLISPPGPGLNLSRRAQALRMHNRGESINSIAPALGAPKNEIELLVKVQQLLQQRTQ